MPAHTPAVRERAAGSRILRLVVAGGLTAYILWKSHPRDVFAAAAAADWRPVAVAVLLVLADRGLMAYRWIVLLYTLDPAERPGLPDILRIFFVSTFIGTFLPSVGGDAVRAYSIANVSVGGGDAIASVFMDRMLGIASLFLMALAGLALARDLAGNWVILGSLGVAALACAVTLLLVFSQRADAMTSIILTWFPAPARLAGQRVLQAIQRYAAHHVQLVKVLVCSVAVQVLRILQAYYLGRALGLDVPLGTYFAFLPLILLVMLLPVTVSGLGTGQAAFLWFFARSGVPAAAAFALSALFIGLGVVGNLPGALLYATGPRTRRG
jgi:uncharacterized protein (TIRG00374 family)